MDSKMTEKLKNKMCMELERLSAKGNLTTTDLDSIHKLTDTVKNLDKIECLESDSSYGGTRGIYPDDSYRGMRSSRGMRGSYGRMDSYRGYDYSHDGNSRENTMFTKEVNDMLGNNYLSEQEKETLMKALEIMRV